MFKMNFKKITVSFLLLTIFLMDRIFKIYILKIAELEEKVNKTLLDNNIDFILF